MKIRSVRIPLLIPLRIFWESLDAVEDVSLFCRFHKKVDVSAIIKATAQTVQMLASMGRFDLVDVDVGQAGEKVKIKVCLR